MVYIKPAVKVGKNYKPLEFGDLARRWPVSHSFDLCKVHPNPVA
jgi:hypothetical protein